MATAKNETKNVTGLDTAMDRKEAEYDLAGTKVRVAVTSGLTNAAKLMDRVKNGEADMENAEPGR